MLDFGLSKVANDKPDNTGRQRQLTAAQHAMGTPNYMSPEQWVSARDVGPPADQWALATILFELIAGVPPFEGEQLAHICTKVLNAPPPPLLQLRPDTPPALEQALLIGLQKTPHARYPDMAAFVAAIAPFGSSASHRAAERIARMFQQAELIDQSQPGVSLGMASSPGSSGPICDPPTPFPSVPRAQTAQSWQQMMPPQRKSRRALFAGLAAIVVLVGVVLVVMLGQLGTTDEGGAVVPGAADRSSGSAEPGQGEAEDDPAADQAVAGSTSEATGSASAAQTASASAPAAVPAAPPRPSHRPATTTSKTPSKKTTRPRGWPLRKPGKDIFDGR